MLLELLLPKVHVMQQPTFAKRESLSKTSPTFGSAREFVYTLNKTCISLAKPSICQKYFFVVCHAHKSANFVDPSEGQFVSQCFIFPQNSTHGLENLSL